MVCVMRKVNFFGVIRINPVPSFQLLVKIQPFVKLTIKSELTFDFMKEMFQSAV